MPKKQRLHAWWNQLYRTISNDIYEAVYNIVEKFLMTLYRDHMCYDKSLVGFTDRRVVLVSSACELHWEGRAEGWLLPAWKSKRPCRSRR
jgi:hypothetical protein